MPILKEDAKCSKRGSDFEQKWDQRGPKRGLKTQFIKKNQRELKFSGNECGQRKKLCFFGFHYKPVCHRYYLQVPADCTIGIEKQCQMCNLREPAGNTDDTPVFKNVLCPEWNWHIWKWLNNANYACLIWYYLRVPADCTIGIEKQCQMCNLREPAGNTDDTPVSNNVLCPEWNWLIWKWLYNAKYACLIWFYLRVPADCTIGIYRKCLIFSLRFSTGETIDTLIFK